MKIKLTGAVEQHRSDTFEQNPRKRREREWSRKRIYRNNCQTFPKLDERYKYTEVSEENKESLKKTKS